MPWTQVSPDAPPLEPSRGGLVMLGIMTFPEILGNWFGQSGADLGVVDRAAILSVAAAILGVCYFIGRVFLIWLKLDQKFSHLESTLFSLLVGLTLVSFWTCVGGQLGLLHQPILFSIPIILFLIVGARSWKRQLFTDQNAQEQPIDESSLPDHETKWWLLGSAPLILFVVGVSMMPPYEYDVLEYHLQVPKEWYQSGQITTLRHNVYSGLPMAAEVWALVPMIYLPLDESWFFGSLVGKLLMGLSTLAIAAILYAAGLRIGNVWTARAAAITALSTPWLVYESATGLVDGVWALFSLAACYPLVVFWKTTDEAEQDSIAFPVLSGLFAGMAFSVKYPALLMCVVPLSVLWIVVGRRRLKSVTVFLLVVGIVSAPWLVKNTIRTGNPVYPLAGNVFSSDVRTSEQIAQWSQAHQVPKNAQGHRYSLSQLFNGLLTILGKSPWIGLAMVPLAIFSFRFADNKLVGATFALILTGAFIWWGFTHRLERFIIPLLPLGCLWAGMGATGLCQFAAGRFLTRGLLIGGLLTTFFLANLPLSIKIDPRILVATDSLRAEYQPPVIRFLNSNTDAGNTILATGDATPFYWNRTAFYHTCFDDSSILPLIEMDKSERRDWLHAHRVQWIYVNWREIERFRSRGNYGFPSYVEPKFFEELEQQGLIRRVTSDGEIQFGGGNGIYQVIGQEHSLAP